MSDGEETTLYPSWKEAVENALAQIEGDPEAFFSDATLTEWFHATMGSDSWRFQLLAWKDRLEARHNVYLLRVRNEGYKVANASERIREVGPSFEGRYRRLISRGLTMLKGTDYAELSAVERELHDRQTLRFGCALIAASPRIQRELSAQLGQIQRPASTLEFLMEREDEE